MKELMYPFDSSYILKNKKKLKKLLDKNSFVSEKKIAVLGGSTTNDITKVLELFLLNYRIKPIFYESEYNKYYEDAVFGNPELDEFKPDIIYLHTTFRNITRFPHPANTSEEINKLLGLVSQKGMSLIPIKLYFKNTSNRLEKRYIMNEIDKVISKLSDEEKHLIFLRYGKDLHNPISKSDDKFKTE